MTAARWVETAFVLSLFAGYLGLWRFKRARDLRRTGIDPEVLRKASSPVQNYFAGLLTFMTGLVAVMVLVHAVGPDSWAPLTRAGALEGTEFDILGLGIGVAGLGLCALAQFTMGSSWRVGIDAEHRTELVTQGIYRWVRNPTYVGLHLVNLGLWWIWPTTLVAAFACLFFVIMDIQVRCEEEFLVQQHGESYRTYMNDTWRYLPWVY